MGKCNSMITDKVRSALIKKGVIVWGPTIQEEVQETSHMLQQIKNGGRLIFKRKPDGLYSLLHASVGYGVRDVTLGNHTQTLLGARMRHGVPCYSSVNEIVKLRGRLSKLGVDTPIEMF